MERPVITCIEWTDPDTKNGWKDPKDVVQEVGESIVSVGMLVHEDDNTIILCMDWAKDGDVNSRGRIPKSLVTKRKDIKLPVGIWKELRRVDKKKATTNEIKDTIERTQ